jgi:hypothetical protein
LNNINEFLQKNKAVLVISVLIVLLVGAFAVWKFYPGLGSQKDPFRIDQDLLLKEQASTKKSTATTDDPIHAKINCDKNKNLNLSLKNEKEVVDQKSVQCKKEETQVTFDNQIKPGENYRIDVEDSTFTEGQNNAQSNGDQQAAQDQAADLVGNQEQANQQQQTGNQSPTNNQQVASTEEAPNATNQEKPGSDSPNQNDTSKTNAATGDNNPNLMAFGWGFDAGSNTGNSKPNKPQKPDKQDQPNKPENQGTEEDESSDSSSGVDSSSDEATSDESSSDESTSDSSNKSSGLLSGGKNILKPEPKPEPKPKTTKPSANVSVNNNQSKQQKKNDDDQLEVHISAFQSQKSNSTSSTDSSSQVDIDLQQPTKNKNNDQQPSTDTDKHQNQQPPAQENEPEPKPKEESKEQPKPKAPTKISLEFPGAEKFTKNATGPEIKTLITLLNKSGYQTREKQKFTSEVSREVQKFQQDQGWTGKDADGIPGLETWKRLVNNYKGGFPGVHYFTKKTQNNGYFVKKLEKKLYEKGLISKVTKSGKYTDTMKKAVQKFQKSQGWTGKGANGIPGKETWKRLMK